MDDEGGLDSENKKWVFNLRAVPPVFLKPIYTIPVETEEEEEGGGEMEEEECSTTPKGVEARIPTTLTCPPAPRKRKPSLKCNYHHGREFFNPPELETVFFRRHVERAS